MNFKRGFIAGLAGTVTGALIPIVWIGGYTLLYWLWHDSPAMDREADLKYWREYGAGPVIGMAAYFGLSAWATYTPPGHYRFIRTLGLLSLISISLSMLILQLWPAPMHKGPVDAPVLDYSDFAFILLPPLTVACSIVLFRWLKSEKMNHTLQQT